MVPEHFDFRYLLKNGNQLWVIFHGDDSQVCPTAPGCDEDLVGRAEARAFAEWRLGRIEWSDAVEAERFHVSRRELGQSLPTWNRRSELAS